MLVGFRTLTRAELSKSRRQKSWGVAPLNSHRSGIPTKRTPAKRLPRPARTTCRMRGRFATAFRNHKAFVFLHCIRALSLFFPKKRDYVFGIKRRFKRFLGARANTEKMRKKISRPPVGRQSDFWRKLYGSTPFRHSSPSIGMSGAGAKGAPRGAAARRAAGRAPRLCEGRAGEALRACESLH